MSSEVDAMRALSELKSLLDTKVRERATAQARADEAKTRAQKLVAEMKDKFGVTSVKEAQKLLAEKEEALNVRIEEMQKAIR